MAKFKVCHSQKELEDICKARGLASLGSEAELKKRIFCHGMYLLSHNNGPYVWNDNNEILTPEELIIAAKMCYGNIPDWEVGAILDNPGALPLHRCTRITSPQYEDVRSTSRSFSNNGSSYSNTQSPTKTQATSSMSTSGSLLYSSQNAGRITSPTKPPAKMPSSHDNGASHLKKQNVLPRMPSKESDDGKNARAQLSLANTQRAFAGGNLLPQFEAAAHQNVAALSFQNTFDSAAAGGNNSRSRNPSGSINDDNGHGSLQPGLHGATLARNLIAMRYPEVSERARRTSEYVLAHQKVPQYGNENDNMSVEPTYPNPPSFPPTSQRRPSTQNSGWAPMSYLSSYPDHRASQHMIQCIDQADFRGSGVYGNEQANMINTQAYPQVFQQINQPNYYQNGSERAPQHHTAEFPQSIPVFRLEGQQSMLAQDPFYNNCVAPARPMTILASNEFLDVQVRGGEALGSVRIPIIIPDNDDGEKNPLQTNGEQGLIHWIELVATNLYEKGFQNLSSTWGGNIPGIALHQYKQQCLQMASNEVRKYSAENQENLLSKKSLDGYDAIAIKYTTNTTTGDISNRVANGNRFSTGHETSDLNNTATDNAKGFANFHAAVNVNGAGNADKVADGIRANSINGSASILGKRPRSRSSGAKETTVPKKIVKRAPANGTFRTRENTTAPSQSVFMGGPDVQSARASRASKNAATHFTDFDSFGRWDELANSDVDVLDCITVKTPDISTAVDDLPKNNPDLYLEDHQLLDSLTLFPGMKFQSSNTLHDADDHSDWGGYFADATLLET